MVRGAPRVSPSHVSSQKFNDWSRQSGLATPCCHLCLVQARTGSQHNIPDKYISLMTSNTSNENIETQHFFIFAFTADIIKFLNSDFKVLLSNPGKTPLMLSRNLAGIFFSLLQNFSFYQE